jgi:hypothetical protein
MRLETNVSKFSKELNISDRATLKSEICALLFVLKGVFSGNLDICV